MPSSLVMTQNQGAPRQQVTTEERKQIISQFENQFYGLSTLFKERLLITSDYQFTRKMHELQTFAKNGSVYTN